MSSPVLEPGAAHSTVAVHDIVQALKKKASNASVCEALEELLLMLGSEETDVAAVGSTVLGWEPDAQITTIGMISHRSRRPPGACAAEPDDAST
jgi:hypothetical protein